MKEEYWAFRKVLYSAVTTEASDVTLIFPEKSVVLIDGTGTMYASTKGTGSCVCLTQFPVTDGVRVTE